MPLSNQKFLELIVTVVFTGKRHLCDWCDKPAHVERPLQHQCTFK